MTLTIDIKLNSESFRRLNKIKNARDESMTETVNHLLTLGIDVYLMEDGILEDV